MRLEQPKLNEDVPEVIWMKSCLASRTVITCPSRYSSNGQCGLVRVSRVSPAVGPEATFYSHQYADGVHS
jgi:hypothetical protein